MKQPYQKKAFPLAIADDVNEVEEGMTLRDYFAAQVVCYFLSEGCEDAEHQAYFVADKMMQERQKEHPNDA